ncbi:hypothetical protein [Candidatus Electronema sp. JC]|uniref:hypothetical protein n=1 Tax=Candidatus Electronema sp. JC TaxID=3401570 RepID=UPI003AA9342B
MARFICTSPPDERHIKAEMLPQRVYNKLADALPRCCGPLLQQSRKLFVNALDGQ